MDKEVKEALFQFKRSIAINHEMGMTSINNERNIIIVKYIDDLQQRIDKAVEYIEKLNEMTQFDFDNEYWMMNLENILKGDDKNE